MKDNTQLNWHDWVWRVWLYLKTRREHRRTIKQLNKLTDRQLSDIGLKRSDIDDLIWLQQDEDMRGKGEDS